MTTTTVLLIKATKADFPHAEIGQLAKIFDCTPEQVREALAMKPHTQDTATLTGQKLSPGSRKTVHSRHFILLITWDGIKFSLPAICKASGVRPKDVPSLLDQLDLNAATHEADVAAFREGFDPSHWLPARSRAENLLLWMAHQVAMVKQMGMDEVRKIASAAKITGDLSDEAILELIQKNSDPLIEAQCNPSTHRTWDKLLRAEKDFITEFISLYGKYFSHAFVAQVFKVGHHKIDDIYRGLRPSPLTATPTQPAGIAP